MDTRIWSTPSPLCHSLQVLKVCNEESQSLQGPDRVSEVLLGIVHLFDITRNLLHLMCVDMCTVNMTTPQ